MTDLLSEYRWRGMLADATEGVADELAKGNRTAYIGFDPTGASLHVGSLLTIMGLVHFQRAGHTPVGLVGGGTGLIGDPSGKTSERQLLSAEDVERNLAGIRSQLEHFLDFEVKSNPARMVNNLDWLGKLGAIDFLRDVGKHFSVNAMLRKETVRRRIEDDEVGISYTEFSYGLLQAYDFWALYDQYGCTMQMGGSDQWGNITTGIDYIRRVTGERAYGIVYPLLTTSSGGKFGKTESGAVWLDPELTSPYRFFQFWLNADDADVGHYLRCFTLMSQPEIIELEAAMAERPQERAAQRALARDVTERVHGPSGLAKAEQATRVLFGGSLDGMTAADIEDVFSDVPSSTFSADRFGGEGAPLIEVLADSGLASSKGDARRAIDGGGIYVNNERASGVDHRVHIEAALEGRFFVLRKGKKNYHLVRVEGGRE